MDPTTNDRLVNALETRSVGEEDRRSRTSIQSIESCEFISCKEDIDDAILMKEVDEDPYDTVTLLVLSILFVINMFLPIALMFLEDSLSTHDQIDHFIYNMSLFDLYVIGVSFNFFATLQLQKMYYNLNYVVLAISSYVIYCVIKVSLFHRLTSNVFVSIVCVISFCTLVPLLIVVFKRHRGKTEYTEVSVNEKLLQAETSDDNLEKGEVKYEHASFGRLFRLTRPQYWTLFYATMALVISTVAMLANPFFFGKIVNACNTDGSHHESNHKLNTYAVALVVLFTIGGIATGFRGYLFSVVGERLVKKIRMDLFEKIIHQDMAFFDRNKTGELMNRLASDTTVIQSSLSVNISMGLRSVAQVTVSFILLFVTSWKLTLVMMTVVPFIIIVVNVYGKFTKELTTDYQNALAASADTGSESISNARVMRSFGAELLEFNRYLSRLNATYEKGKLKCKAYGGFVGGITILANGAITVVIYYGATLVIAGSMTVGSLTAFILYTIYIALGLGIISGLYAEFMNAVGASERIFQIMDQEPSIPTSGGIWPHPPNESDNPISKDTGGKETSVGDIELKDVTFAYPTRIHTPVLKNFNLTIKPHKTVAIVGSSGSGKSTVLCLLERFYDVNSGSININGINIKSLDPRYLHQMLSIVPQEPVLFSGTIRSNIIYARQAAAYGQEGVFLGESDIPESDIIEACKKANAHSFISQFPDGYNTIVGERGIRLSGGQKQRVAIARALLANPKVLLLDEATSALDSESEQLVQESIYRLMNDRTVIVIAHRLSTVRHADMIVVCGAQGHVVESGTHEELIALNGSYAKLVSRQLESSNNENQLLQLV